MNFTRESSVYPIRDPAIIKATEEGFTTALRKVLEFRMLSIPFMVIHNAQGTVVQAGGLIFRPSGKNDVFSTVSWISEIVAEASFCARFLTVNHFPFDALVVKYPFLHWIFVDTEVRKTFRIAYYKEGAVSSFGKGTHARFFIAFDGEEKHVQVSYGGNETEISILNRLLWQCILQFPTADFNYQIDVHCDLHFTQEISCANFERLFCTKMATDDVMDGKLKDFHRHCGAHCNANVTLHNLPAFVNALGVWAQHLDDSISFRVLNHLAACDDGCPMFSDYDLEGIEALPDNEGGDPMPHELGLIDETPSVVANMTHKLQDHLDMYLYPPKWETVTVRTNKTDGLFVTIGRLEEGNTTECFMGQGLKLQASRGDAARSAYLHMCGDTSPSPVTMYHRLSSIEKKIDGNVSIQDLSVLGVHKPSPKGSALMHVLNGEVALISERPGKPYTLVGGKAENGENPVATIVREFKEETGADPKKFVHGFLFKSKQCTVFSSRGESIPKCLYRSPRQLPRDIAPWVVRVLHRYATGKEMSVPVTRVYDAYAVMRDKGSLHFDGPIPLRDGTSLFFNRLVADRGKRLFDLLKANFDVVIEDWN
jgi:8-oxo-dGTP pyrophosphatase MutT (NUDIX family)